MRTDLVRRTIVVMPMPAPTTPGAAPGALRRGAGRLARAALLALACACGLPAERPGAEPFASVTDDAGRTVALPDRPERVVSLIPAVTETLLALGAADRLVARTDFDLQPELAHLPSVGAGLTPSLEWLVAQRPDLVVGWPDERSRTLISRLEAAGIPVYGARIESIADIRSTVSRIGQLLGARAGADSVLAAMDERLEAVAAAVAGRPRPDVVYLVDLDPAYAAGPGTFIHEALGLAGARNALEDLDALWPQVAVEEIVRRDPDRLVVSRVDPDDDVLRRLRSAPGWRRLDAVRAGRVDLVHADHFNRPGPGVARAVEDLARRFHPDALP